MDTKELVVKVKGELHGPNTERNGVSCECFEPSAQGGEFLVEISDYRRFEKSYAIS